MSNGSIAESYGWSGTGAARDIDPSYTPDMAAAIDGDGEETETDLYVAGELLREILAFAYAYRGDKPQPDLRVAFMRFTCITWLVTPDLLGNISLAELGPQLGYTRANLSKFIRDFGDRLGGLRNRLQKTEGARRIYAQAQLRDHWRNRAKKKPAAPCGTAGCHAEHSKQPLGSSA
jgi:hypothetical protein